MKRNKTPSVSDWMEKAGNKIPRISDFNQREKRMPTSVPDSIHKVERDSPSTVRSESSLKIIKEIRCPTYSRRSTSFHFKKYATPLKPSPRKKLRNSNEFCSAFDNSFAKGRSAQIESRRNPKNTRNLRPKRGVVNYNETDTLQSSPYLSVFEAKRAKEFTFM